MLVSDGKSHVAVDIDNGCPRSWAGGGGRVVSEASVEKQGCSHECGPDEIVGESETEKGSCVSECRVEVVDLENNEVGDVKVHLGKVEERDCRICHLSIDMSNHESGAPIELGCSCKDDLAAAHKHCAEAWFKIKGNKTCEICGSIARNVAGAIEVETAERLNEANNAAMVLPTVPAPPAETRNFWQGHRFLNSLLACMVFAFVISWLFHFNVPS